ncbi:uncharacterized protein L203_106038 [Cryptococcus depauperatus CBS 7841]|uniref:Uncharacterized protein n=1 Tax=Cryptococcus depauperatus CBS 7841 TaxID=1295531 RepID=A0A1E3IV42_9TREE|nr:hypothetical protein L203_00744 [Cryptococcus depauperatus CBS 7841]
MSVFSVILQSLLPDVDVDIYSEKAPSSLSTVFSANEDYYDGALYDSLDPENMARLDEDDHYNYQQEMSIQPVRRSFTSLYCNRSFTLDGGYMGWGSTPALVFKKKGIRLQRNRMKSWLFLDTIVEDEEEMVRDKEDWESSCTSFTCVETFNTEKECTLDLRDSLLSLMAATKSSLETQAEKVDEKKMIGKKKPATTAVGMLRCILRLDSTSVEP